LSVPETVHKLHASWNVVTMVTCDDGENVERRNSKLYIYIYIYIYMRNEEVLLRVNDHRNILHEIRKRKANWVGHIDKGRDGSDKKTRKKS
jgi:hypothetical protein